MTLAELLTTVASSGLTLHRIGEAELELKGDLRSLTPARSTLSHGASRQRPRSSTPLSLARSIGGRS